ncbi:MAG: hypothetical protein ACLFM7_10450 [Bacteroidales bacterium]
MKRVFAILFLSGWFVLCLTSLPVKAQEDILERKIHLEMEQQPLHKVLTDINQLTDYKFSYNTELVDENKLISFSYKNTPLKTILDSLFNDPTLVYEVVGRHIVVHKNHKKSEPEEPISEQNPEVPKPSPLYKQMNITKIDTNYTHKWREESGKWELFNREIKLYKKNQRLAGTLNERWNAQKGIWENYDRTIKNYDDKGNLIENLNQQWSPAQDKWINLKLKTFSYDRYGNKSEVLYHEWQQAAGQWFSTVRYLINYNIFGEQKKVLIKVYSPATETWSNATRYTFIYNDGIGPPDETLVESWNSFTESWDNRGKYYMHYNLRGNKVKETRSTWNENMNQWINGLRFIMDYDNRQLTSEIEQRWDYKDNEWNNAIRSIFSYDEEGEVKQMVKKRWNRDSSKWETRDIYIHSNIKDFQEETPAGKDEKDNGHD